MYLSLKYIYGSIIYNHFLCVTKFLFVWLFKYNIIYTFIFYYTIKSIISYFQVNAIILYTISLHYLHIHLNKFIHAHTKFFWYEIEKTLSLKIWDVSITYISL